MAQKEMRATAKLFLDTSNATSDAKQFVADLKRKLNEIETAADKMTVFKDMASYIGEIDKSLAALKAKDGDAFIHMFDGMDEAFKKEFEKVFRIAHDKVSELNSIRDLIGNATKENTKTEDLKKWANTIQELYKSMGVDVKFSGRSFTSKIQEMQVAVDSFATVWGNVMKQMATGFQFGGTGSGGIGGFSDAMQKEIDALEAQQEKYRDILKHITSLKRTLKNDNLISLNFEATEDEAKRVIALFKELDDKHQEFLNQGDSSSVAYYENLIKRAEAAMQLQALNEKLSRKNEFGEIIKPSPRELRSIVGSEEWQYSLDDFNDTFKEMQTAFKNEIESLAKQVQDVASGSVGGSGTNSAESQIQQVGQHAVSTTEYIRGMTLALKEMFAVMRQNATAEYKILINGQEIDARAGNAGEVTAATMAEAYLSNLSKDIDVDAHSHMGRSAMIDAPDLQNAINRQYNGLAKISAIIGNEYITTLDFANVKIEDARAVLEKLKALTAENPALQSVSAKKINKMFAEINPAYANIAQTWNPSQFDGLAQKIFDVKQNAEQAIDPLERFKNILMYMTDGKIDLSKYDKLLNTFSADKAGNIFNQIMKAEGIKEDGKALQVGDLSAHSLDEVIRNIQEQKIKLENARKELGLTYQDVRAEIDKYMQTGDRSFFEKFYHVQDLNDLFGQFADVQDGISDINTLSNKLAIDFGVDPADLPIAAIEQTGEAAQETVDKAELAQRLVKQFNEVISEMGNGIESADSANYYEGQLDAIRDQIEELHELGHVSEKVMDQVNAAYEMSKPYIEYARGRNNTFNELAELNNKATLTQDKEALDEIIQKRKQLIDMAEGAEWFNEDELEQQRAITAEIEKRIQLQKSAQAIETSESDTETAVDKIKELYKTIEQINKEDRKIEIEIESDNIKAKNDQLKDYLGELIKIEAQEKKNGSLTQEELNRRGELVDLIQDMNLNVRYKDGSYYSTNDFPGINDLSKYLAEFDKLVSKRKKITLGFYQDGYGALTDTLSGTRDYDYVRNGISAFEDAFVFDDSMIGQLIREYQDLHEVMLKCMLVGQDVPKNVTDRLNWFESLDATKLEELIPKLTQMRDRINDLESSDEMQGVKSYRYGEDESYYDQKIQRLQQLIQLREEYYASGGVASEDDLQHLSSLKKTASFFEKLKQGAEAVQKLKSELKGLYSDIDFKKDNEFESIFRSLQEGFSTYENALQGAKKVYEDLNNDKQVANAQETTAALQQTESAYEGATEAAKEYQAAAGSTPPPHTHPGDGLTMGGGPLPDDKAAAGGTPPPDGPNEIVDLERLSEAVEKVTTAVNTKTGAFTAEAATVASVVNSEIADLNRLEERLRTLSETIATLFSNSAISNEVFSAWKADLVTVEASIKNIADVLNGIPDASKLFDGMDKLEDAASEQRANVMKSIFGPIEDAMNKIHGILAGFTGLEASAEGSIAKKKPVADGATTNSEMQRKLTHDIATEATLQSVREAINNLTRELTKPKDDEEKNALKTAINELTAPLLSAVKSLHDVANGIIQHQKAQKQNTIDATQRLLDSKQRVDISASALTAGGKLGADPRLSGLTALKDGLVLVEGAFKNATGEWEGFTVKVNESNEAVDLAIKKQSAFAKELNKTGGQLEEDNKVKYNPAETYKKALEYAQKLEKQGKKATVQYKDSGRHTVSIEETIGGLTRTTFQTFDEDVSQMERTTVTVANNVADALRETNKFIAANDSLVGNANALDTYNKSYEKLLDLNKKYGKRKRLSKAEQEEWNKQIDLVKLQGAEVSSLIKQRQKLDMQQGVVTSKNRIQQYQTDIKKILSGTGLNVNSITKDADGQSLIAKYEALTQRLNDLKKSSSVLTDDQITDINTLVAELTRLANAYNKTAAENEAANKKREATAKLPETKASQLDEMDKYEKGLKNSAFLTDDLKNRIANLKTELQGINDVDALEQWATKWQALQKDINDQQASQDIANRKAEIERSLQDRISTLKSLSSQLGLDLEADKLSDDAQKIKTIVDKLYNTKAVVGTTSQDDISNLRSEANQLIADLERSVEQAKQKAKDKAAEKAFGKKKDANLETLDKYQRDAGKSIALTKELTDALDQLRGKMANVADDTGLKAWEKEFEDVQNRVTKYQDDVKKRNKTKSQISTKTQIDQVENISKELNAALSGLNFKITDRGLIGMPAEIKDEYRQVMQTLDEYKIKIQNGENVELDSVTKTINALHQKINVYKKAMKVSEAMQSRVSKQRKTQEQIDSQTQVGQKNMDITNRRNQARGLLSGLDFKLNDVGLKDDAQRIVQDYNHIMRLINEARVKSRHGEVVDFSEIDQEIAKLKELVDVRKELNKQDNIKKAQDKSDTSRTLSGLSNDLKRNFKELNFKEDSEGLNAEQQRMVDKYKELTKLIRQSQDAVQHGGQVNVDAIKQETSALLKQIQAYKDRNNIRNAKGGTASTYGLRQVQNAVGKYNSLIAGASDIGLDKNATDVKNLVSAYEKLIAAQKAFKSGEDLTTDVGGAKIASFREAQAEFTKYSKALNQIITDTQRLSEISENEVPLSPAFENTLQGRRDALRQYVNDMYGAAATQGNFSDSCRKMAFTIKNADGTFTEMTASINTARNSIVAISGDVKKVESLFSSLTTTFSGKFKELWVYATARLGVDEVIQAVRSGFQQVLEIDTALTELKKVTDETGSAYDAFLQKMSKTGSVVGSTVSNLTTMAAEWGRLGYSLEEAGILAENTAILMNVSEFDDATTASEALISTMQAFEYLPEESRHVVDILNEVGNNYAVSSDGLATALKDSASALMEGGNSMEQAVALVAAANRVVNFVPRCHSNMMV